MIPRYTTPEMARIWSEENRVLKMCRVEILYLRALARRKRIGARELRRLEPFLKAGGGVRLRRRLARLMDRMKSAEEKSGHEVVGLITALSQTVCKGAPTLDRYLHYGLTSSDILDTVFAMQLVEAADLLLAAWSRVARRIAGLSRRHAGTWMAGRTHGIHAEPITFGFKLAGWHAESLRSIERLKCARESVAYGKLSGAVGAFTHAGPNLEAEVLRRLRLRGEPVATQVVPRDRHSEYYHALVLSACAIERFATEIRHLQRTEVLEVEEPFSGSQKGSSAMPHKRNPVLCENLCGLARTLRTFEPAVVENAVLWHERDISHSSVERVVFPDATILLHFMLGRFLAVLQGLQVHPERMRLNLQASGGLVFSQKVLLTLVDRGLSRLKAYDLVQRTAMRSFKMGRPFREVLGADPQVRRVLSDKDLVGCFDLKAYGKAVRGLLRRGGVVL